MAEKILGQGPKLKHQVPGSWISSHWSSWVEIQTRRAFPSVLHGFCWSEFLRWCKMGFGFMWSRHKEASGKRSLGNSYPEQGFEIHKF